jgi:hypothetical protein
VPIVAIPSNGYHMVREVDVLVSSVVSSVVTCSSAAYPIWFHHVAGFRRPIVISPVEGSALKRKGS